MLPLPLACWQLLFHRQAKGIRSAIRYTRDGAFYLSPLSDTETMVVTGNGYPVLDENNNPITINGRVNDYEITTNGRLIAKMENGGTSEFNLGVVQVNKPQFLEQKGGNLLGLPENMAELNVPVNEILTELNGPMRNQVYGKSLEDDQSLEDDKSLEEDKSSEENAGDEENCPCIEGINY